MGKLIDFDSYPVRTTLRILLQDKTTKKNIIWATRGNGFSKVSFCKKTEIYRPTLDKILNGEIDSKSTFDKHLNKIFTSLSISPDTLMGFSTKTQSVDAVCAQNALINYQMNDKAKMEYDLLQDILNLCSVYYSSQLRRSYQRERNY